MKHDPIGQWAFISDIVKILTQHILVKKNEKKANYFFAFCSS